MNDLETRLPKMLSDAADRFTIRPDLDGAATPNRTRLVVGADNNQPSRPFMLAGVAAAIVVLIGGLVVVASRTSDEPAASGDAPAAVSDPLLFPVVDDVPTWAGDLYGSYRIPDGLAQPQQVWAVLARPDKTGSGFSDQIVVLVQEERRDEDRDGFEELVVDDRTVFVRRSAADPDQMEMVLSPDAPEPFVSVSGSVDEALLARVLVEITVSETNTDYDVTVGDIPDGYDLIVEPLALRTPVLSAAASSQGNFFDVAVDSLWPDPRLRVAAFGGDVTAVDVSGTTAWYSQAVGAPEGSFTIAWSPQPGITIVADLSNPGLTTDEAIAIARSIRLTNEDEWRTTLDVEDNPLPESSPLVIGQPVPTPTECESTVTTVDSPECE